MQICHHVINGLMTDPNSSLDIHVEAFHPLDDPSLALISFVLLIGPIMLRFQCIMGLDLLYKLGILKSLITLWSGSKMATPSPTTDSLPSADRVAEERSPWANRPTQDDVRNFTFECLNSEYHLMTLLMSPLRVIILWMMQTGLLANKVSHFPYSYYLFQLCSIKSLC